jgi:hypothetical protein
MAGADTQQVPEMAPARCTQVRHAGAFPESGGKLVFYRAAGRQNKWSGFRRAVKGNVFTQASRTPMSIK